MTCEDLFYELKYRCEVDPVTGTRSYYNRAGQLHCEEGPAILWGNGVVEWWQNGKRHRENGPAIVWPGGLEHWYQNGKLHRTDGPAVVDYNDVGFWIDGHRCTESDYCARTGYVATQGGGMYDTVV